MEPPEGDPLRRWSASGAAIPAGGDGALFAFLSSSKQSVVADPDDDDDLARVHALLERADAVVWSRGSRLAELPMLAPDAIRRAAPHLTVTTITPFGLDGPWSGPRRDRVHAAGVVGRDRRPGSRLAGPGPGVRRRADRRVAHRRLRRDRHDGVAGRVRSATARASSSTCRCSRRSRCASPTTR